MKKKVLFICGSPNQTRQMHEISKFLKDDYDCFFTPFYFTGFLWWAQQKGFLKFALDVTIGGGQFRDNCFKYLEEHNLPIDYRAQRNEYDLIYLCVDTVPIHNFKDTPVILVQEGMTDPYNWLAKLIYFLKLPHYLVSTSLNGLSKMYTTFCVASEGYKKLFIDRGADEKKLVVTGIPNYDHCEKYLENDFPHRHYALVCTSDIRETFRHDNRKKFLRLCKERARGKPMIFKLHPNEKFDRAKKEIDEVCPGSLIFQKGNTDHMIANCDILMTQYSTVVFTGLALGKVVYSYFDMDELKRLVPKQNGGKSAETIAEVGRRLYLETEEERLMRLGSSLGSTLTH